MEYKGKLYGKMGRRYFPLEATTDDWDELTKSKWISVDDMLPEKDTPVIVWNGTIVFPAEREIGYSNEWYDLCNERFCVDTDTVTHWQPLPEPPEPT